MSLFGNLFGSATDKAAAHTVGLIASAAPDIATEAQLREYGDQVSKLGAVVARASQRLSEDQADVVRIEADFGRYRDAAKLLNEKVSGGDASLQGSLNQALQKAELLKSNLQDAQDRAKQSQSDLEAARQNADAAAAHLQAARQRIEDNRRETERAQTDLQREQQRLADAKLSAGIHQGFNPSSAIEDAGQAKLRKLREQTEAARATSDALTHATDNAGGDAGLKAALEEVSSPAKPAQSAADRLAALG